MKQKSALPPDAAEAYTRLCLRLRHARECRHWSRDDTAERCGISRNTLENLEKGKSVTTTALLKVLSLYGMTAELEQLALAENDHLGQALSVDSRGHSDLDDNF